MIFVNKKNVVIKQELESDRIMRDEGMFYMKKIEKKNLNSTEIPRKIEENIE